MLNSVLKAVMAASSNAMGLTTNNLENNLCSRLKYFNMNDSLALKQVKCWSPDISPAEGIILKDIKKRVYIAEAVQHECKHTCPEKIEFDSKKNVRTSEALERFGIDSQDLKKERKESPCQIDNSRKSDKEPSLSCKCAELVTKSDIDAEFWKREADRLDSLNQTLTEELNQAIHSNDTLSKRMDEKEQELASEREISMMNDKTIEDLTQKLRQKESQISILCQEIENKHKAEWTEMKKAESWKSEIDRLEPLIQSLMEELKETLQSNAILAERMEENKQNLIFEKEYAISKDKTIGDLVQKLSEKDNQITKLCQEIENRYVSHRIQQEEFLKDIEEQHKIYVARVMERKENEIHELKEANRQLQLTFDELCQDILNKYEAEWTLLFKLQEDELVFARLKHKTFNLLKTNTQLDTGIKVMKNSEKKNAESWKSEIDRLDALNQSLKEELKKTLQLINILSERMEENKQKLIFEKNNAINKDKTDLV